MGASQSMDQTLLQYGVVQFTKEDWRVSDSILKRTSSTAKLQSVPQDCQPNSLYSSQKHSFIIDQYLIDTTEPLSIEKYLQEIRWRNSCEQLVSVKFIKGFNNSSICRTPLNQNFIYTEHIPLRLSQITDIPFPQNLYLLKACLKGFHEVFLHIRTFQIQQDLICLNEQGKIKVWMNTNLSKNSPQIHNVIKLPNKSQLSLVKDIINIVDLNTDHQFQPKRFKEYLQEYKLYNINFAQCIEAVDNFANLLQITIPNSLQSVYGLFNPLVNKFSLQQLTHTYGRYVDTNETKMVESIPIQRQQRVNTQYISSSNYYIKSVDNYPCQIDIQSTKVEQFETNNVRNLIFHPIIKTEEAFIEQYPSSQTLLELNNQEQYLNDKDWKYFDLNGWADIDPQILLDLKKISLNH